MTACRTRRVPQGRRCRAIAFVAAATGGVLLGPLTAVAPAARNSPVALSTVRAVNVDSGTVSAIAVVGEHGRYRLRVPAGAYLVALSKIRANGSSSDRVASLAVVRAATRHAAGRSAAARTVVTIGRVTLGPSRGAPGSTRNVDALILRDLFGPLTDRGITFVDTTAQVVAASKREQQLSNDGRLATPVSYVPLAPTYVITGEGTQQRDGNVTMTLNLKNLATGQVVATKSVTGKGRSFSQIEGLFGELSSEFAGDASQAIDESRTGGQVTVDLYVVILREGFGSGTVTASPPGRTLTRNDNRFEFKAADGTTVILRANPDAGSYFVGWESGSECGGVEFQSSDVQYPCTVRDPGNGLLFPIKPGANFDSCPMPGTFVNNPNESVCPGVKLIGNQISWVGVVWR